MPTVTPTKNSRNMNVPRDILRAVLEELKLLRKELMLVLPQDDLNDYSNASEIKKSYQKSIKKYPPASV